MGNKTIPAELYRELQCINIESFPYYSFCRSQLLSKIPAVIYHRAQTQWILCESIPSQGCTCQYSSLHPVNTSTMYDFNMHLALALHPYRAISMGANLEVKPPAWQVKYRRFHQGALALIKGGGAMSSVLHPWRDVNGGEVDGRGTRACKGGVTTGLGRRRCMIKGKWQVEMVEM